MDHTRHVWLPLSVGIVGLIVGYSLVVVGKGDIASAAGRSCPMKQEQCAAGACNETCPGNCHQKNA